MAFEITINEKYKYSADKSKPIATGTGGSGEQDTYVSDVKYEGIELTIEQTTKEDITIELNNFVRTDTGLQELDSTEKQNARDNIEVYSKNEIDNITGNLNDLNTIDKSNLVVGINQANSWKEISW